MPVAINVHADVKAATKHLNAIQRRVIPKATNSALNKTGKNVITAVQRRLSKRTGLKIGEISKGLFFRSSNISRLSFDIIGRGRAFTLRRFVKPSKRHPGAFSKKLGVTANPWRKSRVFPGTFIMRGKTHGLPLVVKPKGAGRGVEVLYGPSVRAEFGRDSIQRYTGILARHRFAFNFPRRLNYYLSRI